MNASTTDAADRATSATAAAAAAVVMAATTGERLTEDSIVNNGDDNSMVGVGCAPIELRVDRWRMEGGKNFMVAEMVLCWASDAWRGLTVPSCCELLTLHSDVMKIRCRHNLLHLQGDIMAGKWSENGGSHNHHNQPKNAPGRRQSAMAKAIGNDRRSVVDTDANSLVPINFIARVLSNTDSHHHQSFMGQKLNKGSAKSDKVQVTTIGAPPLPLLYNLPSAVSLRTPPVNSELVIYWLSFRHVRHQCQWHDQRSSYFSS